MTPGARIATAIDLIERIEAGHAPADAVLDGFFRKNRYAGSKDRRAITARVYDNLRHRARLSWRVGAGATARTRVIADLIDTDGADETALAGLFGGSTYAAAALDAGEIDLVARLRGDTGDTPPDAVRLEIPDWLSDQLTARFGADLDVELAALNEPAPLDLRVNTTKASREQMRRHFADEGFDVVPTPLSPEGLRITGRARIKGGPAYRDGLVEIQDEGAQLLTLLVDVRPGMVVVDYCAGAGGKTLGLAAALAGDGIVFAHDASTERLMRMGPRLRRAGVTGVQIGLPEAGEADRVLLDVPCSGTGRWRRAPESKWTLSAAELDDLVVTQRRILNEAAALVKPGGRLVYATCSLLAVENEDQIAAFRADHPAFEVCPVDALWPETIGGAAPAAGADLHLTPHATQTDGFFAAVLQKTA